MTEFFVYGFIKSATEHGVSEDQAIEILKQAMGQAAVPPPVMPTNNGMANPSTKMAPTSMSAAAPVSPTPAAPAPSPTAPKLK